MGCFKLEESMIDVISSEFALSSERIKHIYDEYNTKINSFMENQYMGHSIRAIEQFVFEKKGNHSVHIKCWEVPDCLHPMYLEYPSYFLISYPPGLDEKDVRMSIAHELGHLFFNTQERMGIYKEEDKKNLEAIANVFGLLVILGRKAFYEGKIDPFKDAAWQRIIRDYANICKPRKTDS